MLPPLQADVSGNCGLSMKWAAATAMVENRPHTLVLKTSSTEPDLPALRAGCRWISERHEFLVWTSQGVR